ncbi:MAG TPA: glucosyl-3-phosphoglycerate synthase [Candidatus Limnocylindria bacterium]|jgi:glucosyl-3-phosphoglycerate synthase
MTRRRGPYRILMPLANPRTARDLVRIGSHLAPRRPTEITALGIVEVPEGVSLAEGASRAREARRLLQRVPDFRDDASVEVRTAVRIGRQAAEGIVEAVAETGADLVIFGWAGPPRREQRRAVFSTTIDEVAREAPCDIAVVKQRGLGTVSSILVPVRGGPNAELALRLATDLARGFGAELVVLHVIPPGADAGALEREHRALAALVRRAARGVDVRHRVVEAPTVRGAILKESADHQLVVIGASINPGGIGSGRRLFGRLAETVAARSKATVMVVRTRQPLSPTTFAELKADEASLPAADEAIEQDRRLPTVVDRWFAENTFHASEFRNLRQLVELKERDGLTISVGLPTLNEEKTVGLVIRRIRDALMERVPLVDEIQVIDSASTDRTVEIARELGVPVRQHDEILPELGSHTGKGEALWKSLHELRGDIVVWVDTDIRNIQPRFVYGLLGPLLREPRIQYVKGFYQRPLQAGGQVQPDQGGRVTELTARPLINLFFPELSGVIQPLAGEYAGRRELLESVPFFTGYAVEIGLLIDVMDRVGLPGIGQVDLERRIHRNQSLTDLSRMAFVILKAAITKLEERHQIELLTEMGEAMKQVKVDANRYTLDIREVGDEIRPPMNTIPAYRARRAELTG